VASRDNMSASSAIVRSCDPALSSALQSILGDLKM